MVTTSRADDDSTITRTFRISEKAFLALQEDAKRQNVSVNTLVNQIILAYSSFDRYIKRLHLIKVTRPTFRRVLEASKEDAIIEAGQQAGSDVPKFLMLAKGGALSLQAALDHLRGLADYGNLFEYAESFEGRRRVITLAHELGPKGTLFLAHYVQTVFESVGSHPVFTLGDNSIIIELPP